jgi:uncharacterized protein YhdP
LADSQGAERSAIKALDRAQSYLPNNLAFKAREMQWDGRTLRRVVLGVTRSGALWRGNVESAEFSGYVEYREARAPGEPSTDNAGRLFARFSRMAIGSGDAQEVENLLNEQPASIPALDIVVDDFELQGKKLGRLEVEAINQMAASQREWRLKRFVLSAPDSVFNATGSWSLVTPTTGTPKLGSVKDRRRTSLNFKLDISDAGDALGRFGMKEVVRKGRGDRLKETPELFSGLFWNGQRAVELGLADGLGSLDYVARDIVKAEDLVDYTQRDNVAERLVKRFGASVGEGMGRVMRSSLPSVR